MRYKPSEATEEENSYNYRLEWDDRIVFENISEHPYIKSSHEGPGQIDLGMDFDYAWDEYEDYRNATGDVMYRSVRLIRIGDDGEEMIWAQS